MNMRGRWQLVSHQRGREGKPLEKPSSHAETFFLLVARLKDQHSLTGLFSGFLATLARLIVQGPPISARKGDFLKITPAKSLFSDLSNMR